MTITRLLLLAVFAWGTKCSAGAAIPGTCTTIPFFYYKNLILIKATIEDQEGFLILDTGEPDLVLNAAYFKGWESHNLNIRVNGLEGEVQQVAFKHINLELYGLRWKNVHAKVIDLQHLRHAAAAPILGLLGADLLLEYELIINFSNYEIALRELDGGGPVAVNNYPYRAPDLILPLDRKGHLPITELQIAGHHLWVGLDSGAEVSIFQKSLKKHLQDQVESGRMTQLQSVGKASTRLQLFELHEVFLGPHPVPALTSVFLPLEPMIGALGGRHLDGILGTQFLKRHIVGLNVKTGELSIWYPYVLPTVANNSDTLEQLREVEKK